MRAPLGSRWVGPWVRVVPGFVAVTRGQAVVLRKANAGVEILATLRMPPSQTRAGVRMRPRAEFLFFARPEDLTAAGMSPLGRGWR